MNENIDLTQILKDCPKGTKLYSLIFGEVNFEKIGSDDEYAIFITKLKLFQFSQDKMRIFLNSIQDFVLQNSMHSKNLKNKLFS